MSSVRSALDGGPSDGDREHYWTAALWKYMRTTEQRTLRLTTQMALLTTQVAAWQQAGEEETGNTNRLPLFLLSPDLNRCHWLLGFYRGVLISRVRLFRFTYGDGTKSHLENNVIFIFFRQRWGWLVKLYTQRSEGKLDLGFTDWNIY